MAEAVPDGKLIIPISEKLPLSERPRLMLWRAGHERKDSAGGLNRYVENGDSARWHARLWTRRAAAVQRFS